MLDISLLFSSIHKQSENTSVCVCVCVSVCMRAYVCVW